MQEVAELPTRQADREIILDTVTIVVVTPSLVFGAGLQALLNPDGHGIEVMATTTDIAQVHSLVSEYMPDIVVVDAGHTPFHVEVLIDLTESVGQAGLVVLASPEIQSSVAAVMQSRVAAYLDHSLAPAELVHALKLVNRGRVVMSRQVNDALWEGATNGRGFLTDTERELLKLVAEGLDNEQIAKEIAMSCSSLKRCLNRIESKLGVKNRIQAVAVGARAGWI